MLLSALRPPVSAEAVDCPNPVVDRAIIDAARELCGAATVWQTTVTVDVTTADDYPLSVEDGEIDRPVGGPSVDGRTLHPDLYSYPDPRTLRIERWPNDPGSLTVTLALRPKRGVTEIPDGLASDYETALHAGALYRLLRMPGVAWSNPELAMYYGRLFRARRANAIAACNRGFAQGSVRAAPRRFAAFRR